jgi:hypothetical protein
MLRLLEPQKRLVGAGIASTVFELELRHHAKHVVLSFVHLGMKTESLTLLPEPQKRLL